MEESDLKEIEGIISKIANEVSDRSTSKIAIAVSKTIDERFTAYGFDIRSPIEIQKDMAHLNKMRKLVEAISNKIVMLVFAAIIALFAAIRFIMPGKVS